MNKTQFIEAYQGKVNVTKKEAAVQVEAFLSTVTESLAQGDKINFIGFGAFEVVEKAERESKNPKTGEKIIVPAKKAVKFKAGKALKDTVNK